MNDCKNFFDLCLVYKCLVYHHTPMLLYDRDSKKWSLLEKNNDFQGVAECNSNGGILF